MLITEMIKHLQEIYDMHGDLPMYTTNSGEDKPMSIEPHDVICIAKGNSTKYDDGVYIC